MRMLLHVLMRAVAGFLRSCAEFLLRHAEPVPAAPAAAAVRLPGPPEDWMRRANPPPPAHWVDLVRRRAPSFLASLPEAARAISAGETPAVDGSRIHRRPAASVPSGPTPAPVPVRDRKDGAPVAPRRLAAAKPAEPARRRLRVVTSLEEPARRSPVLEEPSAPGTEPAAPASPEDAAPTVPSPKRPTPEPVFAPFVQEDHAMPELPAEEPRSRSHRDPFMPEPRRARSASVEAFVDPVRKAGTDVLSADWPTRDRRESPVERFDSPRDRHRAWPAETPRSSRSRIPSESNSDGLPAWPDLPSRPEPDVADECLALVREQRRLDARDAEQRGKPWSV